jgi:hypothetical protein
MAVEAVGFIIIGGFLCILIFSITSSIVLKKLINRQYIMDVLSPEEQELVRNIHKAIVLPYVIVVWVSFALMIILGIAIGFNIFLLFLGILYFMNVMCAWVSYKYCPNMKSLKTSLKTIQDKLSALNVDPAVEPPRRSSSTNTTTAPPRTAANVVGDLSTNVYTVFVLFHIYEAIFYLIVVSCAIEYIARKVSSNH